MLARKRRRRSTEPRHGVLGVRAIATCTRGNEHDRPAACCRPDGRCSDKRRAPGPRHRLAVPGHDCRRPARPRPDVDSGVHRRGSEASRRRPGPPSAAASPRTGARSCAAVSMRSSRHGPDPGAWNGEASVAGGRTATVAGMIVLDELVVHGWDLAAATGQPTTSRSPGSRPPRSSSRRSLPARNGAVRPRRRGRRRRATPRPPLGPDRPRPGVATTNVLSQTRARRPPLGAR